MAELTASSVSRASFMAILVTIMVNHYGEAETSVCLERCQVLCDTVMREMAVQ